MARRVVKRTCLLYALQTLLYLEAAYIPSSPLPCYKLLSTAASLFMHFQFIYVCVDNDVVMLVASKASLLVSQYIQLTFCHLWM